jgi:hypothetical protein
VRGSTGAIQGFTRAMLSLSIAMEGFNDAMQKLSIAQVSLCIAMEGFIIA